MVSLFSQVKPGVLVLASHKNDDYHQFLSKFQNNSNSIYVCSTVFCLSNAGLLHEARRHFLFIYVGAL